VAEDSEIVGNHRALFGVQPITRGEFRRISEFMHEAAGVFLSDAKQALVVGRLSKRLGQLGITTFGAYLDFILKGNEAERQYCIDALCTNETHFFREPQHFDFLTRRVFPIWKQQRERDPSFRRLRVWSAACSTGEEPYSLAMVLAENFKPEEGWEIEIWGSDLSTKVLARAESGLFPIQRAAEIPLELRKRYMLRGTEEQEGRMAVKPALRSLVSFRQINLMDDRLPMQGKFQLIFCRNVLIYFDAPTKLQVVTKLGRFLDANGFFFLGHAESLVQTGGLARYGVPTVYTLPAADLCART
jgi:chemotaxis protein methyltransferase CheR